MMMCVLLYYSYGDCNDDDGYNGCDERVCIIRIMYYFIICYVIIWYLSNYLKY